MKNKTQKVKKVDLKQKKVDVVEKKTTQADPVWAIFLIFVGSIFLLNNFEIIPWAIWGEIWRFWPIFLILGGIRLIIGKNVISNIVVSILGFIFLTSILIYTATITSKSFDSWLDNRSPFIHERMEFFKEFTDADLSEKEIIVNETDYKDVSKRIINLELGAQTVTVSDLETDKYLSIESNYIEGFNEPNLEESFDNGTLSLSLDTKGKQWSWGFVNDPYMDVIIGKINIPTSLRTILGAGTATIELDQLALDEITMDIGAGTLNLDLKDNLLNDLTKFDLKVGAGTLNVELPSDENFGWKINYNIGIGELNIKDGEYKGNGTYMSENYSSAEKQVEITVDVGVGTANIELD